MSSRAIRIVPALALAGLLGATAPLVPAGSAQGGELLACTPTALPAASVRPERVCRSPAELDALLRSTYVGRVVIPRDARWEMRAGDGSPLTFIPLRSGIELVGERGDLGSRPLLSTDYRAEGFPLFQVAGSDVRVQGLHLRGPYRPEDRKKVLEGVEAISVTQDAATWSPGTPPPGPIGRGISVADNEIEGFTVAVGVRGTIAVDDPAAYHAGCAPAPECPYPRPTDAPLVKVERNYLHNNAVSGGGYGVVVDGGSYATIEGNVFEYNNHAVAAGGQAYSGYVARFNYVLQGVLTFGDDDTYPHSFDVHGRGRAASSEYQGGPAGTSFDISLNTVLGAQRYGRLGLRTRAAFALRGRPAEAAYFRDNVLVHDGFDEAVKLRRGDDASLDTDRPSTFNLRPGGNRYETDHSAELAAGDFDGDGRTDVFVANGTAWFFSRGGIRPWLFLRASTKRTGQLAFADIDNDRATDVLYRDPAGNLGYVPRGGTAPLVPLTTSPVPVADLRFGDFDGDGLTDIFRTVRGQWSVWYGSARAWRPAQTSSKAISELLFGEFDGVRGTDVAGINAAGWQHSSGATRRWARLNGRVTRSFSSAIAADFDGNGRTDIAIGDGQTWRYSRDGRAGLTPLRRGASNLPYPPLKRLLVGRFDGGPRAGVVTMSLRPRVVGFGRDARVEFGPGERLVIWPGLGSGGAFRTRSEQNMR